MGKYTQEELDRYLISLDTCKDIDTAWRKLGYINASARKGTYYKTPEQKEYNINVYYVKEQAIIKLLARSRHLDIRYKLLNENTGNHVLYVRLSDGVQISFHLYFDCVFNKNLYDAVTNLAKEDCNAEWDGVRDSYTFSAKAYARIRNKTEQDVISQYNRLYNEITKGKDIFKLPREEYDKVVKQTDRAYKSFGRARMQAIMRENKLYK